MGVGLENKVRDKKGREERVKMGAKALIEG